MITIYALLLEDNKYYIGQTKDLEQRMSFHNKGKQGSEWTKKFKPIRVIETIKTNCNNIEEAMAIENATTISYMKKYGWRNVRGGDFCTLDEDKLRFLLTLNSDIYEDLINIKISQDLASYENTHCFFVLKLHGDNYFIGKTNNLKLALLNELNGLGSEWTKMHKPLELLSLFKINSTEKSTVRQLHNDLVINFMKKFGFHKVRGGDFFRADIRNHKNKVLNYTDIFK